MSPQFVIAVSPLTRLYWLVWGGLFLFCGVILGLLTVYAYVVSFFHLGWLLP